MRAARSVRVAAVAPLLVALVAICPAAPVRAQLAGRWNADTARPGVQITDPLLARVYARLVVESPTFRSLVDSVDSGRLPVLVSNNGQSARVTGQSVDLEDSPALARVLAREEDGRHRYVAGMIIVDVETVRRWHARAGDLTARDLEDDVAVLLAHEFIHVASIAMTRSRQSACRDPGRMELLAEQLGHASSSCVVERENRIRAELGLPQRPRYLDPALHIGDRLDIDTMLEEMRLARESRPPVTRFAVALHPVSPRRTAANQ